MIYLTLLAAHIQMAVAQDTGNDSLSQQYGWQEEFPNAAINFGLHELKEPPKESTLQGSANEWWKLFGYDGLNALVALALEENYTLKIAESRVGEARAQTRLAKADLLPHISLNPSFMRQEFSGNRPMPFEGPVTQIRYNTYTLPLDVSYELDVFGKTRNTVEASAFQYKASAASKVATGLQIASDVTKYYVLLLILDSEEQVLINTRKSREENLRIVKIRYDAGLTNEIDLHRAQTELSSVEVQIKNLDIERKEVELALATLAGQTSSQFSIEKVGVQYAVPAIQLLDTTSWALSRPDLQAAGFALEASQKQLKSARKNLYPSLYLSGSTGMLAAESEQVFEGESRNWLLGATLAIPIFEGGRRQSLLNISEHQLEQQHAYLRHQTLVADQQVQQELSEHERLKQQVKAQQDFLLAAQRAAYLSQQRYLKGLVTYLEVVDAERIVLEAHRLSIQLIGKQLLNTVDLMVALGGDLSAIAATED